MLLLKYENTKNINNFLTQNLKVHIYIAWYVYSSLMYFDEITNK